MSNSIKNLNLAQKLYEFEKQKSEEIKKIICNKWLLWSTIKRPLFYLIFNKSNRIEDCSKNKNYAYKYYLVVNLLWKLPYLFTIKKKRITLFFFDSIYNHEKDKNGKYFNYLLGPFADKITDSKRIIISDIVGNNKELRFRPDLFVDEYNIIISLLFRVFKKIDAYKHKIEQLSILISSHFSAKGLDLGVENSQLKNIFYYFQAQKIVYKILFRVLAVETIFCVDSLGTGKVAAAKELGIEVFEFQHGLIDKYKPDYIYNRKLKSMKDYIPLPNKIMCFGDYHANVILKTGFFTEGEILSIGNYKMNKNRQNLFTQAHSNLTIIIPTQWHVYEETKGLIFELIKISKIIKLKLIIKAHPRELKEHILFFEKIAEKEAFISFEKHKNIYACLCVSDICIGFDTTVLLESIALNIPTITISTKEMPDGIHSYLVDTILKKAILSIPLENVKTLLLDYLDNNNRIKENWTTHCKQVGNYLYSNEYEEKVNEIIVDILS